MDVNIVVTPSNIELGVVSSTLQTIDEFRNERQWVSVQDRHSVQFSIVLHRSQRAILLLDEKEGGRCKVANSLLWDVWPRDGCRQSGEM